MATISTRPLGSYFSTSLISTTGEEVWHGAISEITPDTVDWLNTAPRGSKAELTDSLLLALGWVGRDNLFVKNTATGDWAVDWIPYIEKVVSSNPTIINNIQQTVQANKTGVLQNVLGVIEFDTAWLAVRAAEYAVVIDSYNADNVINTSQSFKLLYLQGGELGISLIPLNDRHNIGSPVKFTFAAQIVDVVVNTVPEKRMQITVDVPVKSDIYWTRFISVRNIL